MKIAVFTDTFYPQVNGVVNAIRNYDKMLTGLGHTVTVFTSGKIPSVSELDGAEIRRYRAFTFLPYPEFEYSVDVIHPVTAAVRFKPNIVHAHTPFLMGYCAWMTARRLRLPLVGTFHTPIDEYVMYVAKSSKISQRMLKRIAKYYQDWFYNRCDVIIVPAPAAARYLDVKDKQIIAVSNGIDLTRYGPAGREEIRERFGLGGSPVILHGGRLSFEKRIEGVIDAMPPLLEKVPDAKLMIVGKGPAMKSLEKRVSRPRPGEERRLHRLRERRRLPEGLRSGGRARHQLARWRRSRSSCWKPWRRASPWSAPTRARSPMRWSTARTGSCSSRTTARRSRRAWRRS